MNLFKPAFCLLGFLGSLLLAAPALAAAPEQFKLGAEVAPTKTLPPVDTAKTKVKAGPAKPVNKVGKQAKKPATKTKARKTADVIATDVPRAKLDLTLPKDMVNQLQPPGKEAGQVPVAAAKAPDSKPLLPSLFAPKDGSEPFQLNGRLLTNEMELQMRNENRREVEGAALDFKFKQ